MPDLIQLFPPTRRSSCRVSQRRLPAVRVVDKNQFIGAAFCPVRRACGRVRRAPRRLHALGRIIHSAGGKIARAAWQNVFSALNLDPVFRIAHSFRFRCKMGHRVYEVTRRRAVASALRHNTDPRGAGVIRALVKYLVWELAAQIKRQILSWWRCI
jgi:hypothetical protein